VDEFPRSLLCNEDRYWGEFYRFSDGESISNKYLISDNTINSFGINWKKEIHCDLSGDFSGSAVVNLLNSSCLSIVNLYFECIDTDSTAVLIALATDFLVDLARDLSQLSCLDLSAALLKQKFENVIVTKSRIKSVDELIGMFVRRKSKIYRNRRLSMKMKSIWAQQIRVEPLRNSVASVRSSGRLEGRADQVSLHG